MDKRTKAYKQIMKLGAEAPGQAIQPEPPKPLYKVTLRTKTGETTAEGDNLEQVIIKLTPQVFDPFSYLTIEKDTKKIELKLGAFNCKRLFTHQFTREVKCSQFQKLLV